LGSNGFLLTRLPREILFLIMGLLDVYGLQSLMRCLVVEYNMRVYQPDHRDISTFTPDNILYLAELQALLLRVFPTMYDACVRSQLALIHTRSGARSTTVEGVLEEIRRVASNWCFPLMYFIDSMLCERCLTSLATECYWSNTRPVMLCGECHYGMESSVCDFELNQDKYADGYAWIAPSVMKCMCRVGRGLKVSTFAEQKGIRARSRASYDYANAVERFSIRQDHYFWLDVMPHVQQSSFLSR
jgi:hypothetical protein